MGLSLEEEKQYDRQLRVWGVSAQQRIGAASVLSFAHRGIGGEILKNLVLSGVRRVVLGFSGENSSSVRVVEADLDGAYMGGLAEADLGSALGPALARNLRRLNPLVEVECMEVVEQDSGMSSAAFAEASIVISDIPDFELSERCSRGGKSFFLLQHSGFQGFCFFQDIVIGEKKAPTLREAIVSARSPVDTTVPRHPGVKQFLELCARRADLAASATSKDTSTFKKEAPFVPLSAVLGGVVSQEIVRLVAGSPSCARRNCVFTDMRSMATVVDAVAFPKEGSEERKGGECRKEATEEIDLSD